MDLTDFIRKSGPDFKAHILAEGLKTGKFDREALAAWRQLEGQQVDEGFVKEIIKGFGKKALPAFLALVTGAGDDVGIKVASEAIPAASSRISQIAAMNAVDDAAVATAAPLFRNAPASAAAVKPVVNSAGDDALRAAVQGERVVVPNPTVAAPKPTSPTANIPQAPTTPRVDVEVRMPAKTASTSTIASHTDEVVRPAQVRTAPIPVKTAQASTVASHADEVVRPPQVHTAPTPAKIPTKVVVNAPVVSPSNVNVVTPNAAKQSQKAVATNADDAVRPVPKKTPPPSKAKPVSKANAKGKGPPIVPPFIPLGGGAPAAGVGIPPSDAPEGVAEQETEIGDFSRNGSVGAKIQRLRGFRM